MFQHKVTGEWISGYKDVKPAVLSQSDVQPPPPSQPSNAITFTFSSPHVARPLPPPAALPTPTPVERIVLPELQLPFRNPFDEVMSRLFRRKPTALDMVIRTLFAKYECNWVTLAHITMVLGEYGMSLASPVQLVTCQTGPMPVPSSWGFYFPYFDAQEMEPNKWYFALSSVFYTATQ